MLVVSEIQAGLLPQEFLNVLPIECPYCGHPTEMTDSLTELRCSNPSCPAKLSRRMVGLLTDLGIKGLGESKCADFIEHFGGRIRSPYDIVRFAATWEKAGKPSLSTKQSSEFTAGIVQEIKKHLKVSLWEYVKVGNFEGIRDSARALFDGYKTIEDFYREFNGSGATSADKTAFIAKKLGIAHSAEKVSIKAVTTASTLMTIESELTAYQRFFDIAVADRSVNICISRAVGAPYQSKQDFVHIMNEQYGNMIHINNLSSLSKNCHCLIWSKEGAATSKVTKAKSNNIPIVTGAGFDLILSIMAKNPSVEFTDFLSPVMQAEDALKRRVTLKDLEQYIGE